MMAGVTVITVGTSAVAELIIYNVDTHKWAISDATDRILEF